MSTRRSDLSDKILELLGDQSMTLQEIVIHTSSTDMGVRCCLRAMVQRGELWRTTSKDKTQRFRVTPLAKEIKHGRGI